MKLVKVLLIVLAVLAVIGLLFWQFFLKSQIETASIGTAYGAKQVCSCLFVAEREMSSCQTDFTNDASAINFTITSSNTVENGRASAEDTVTASVLGGIVKSEARFEPGLGCALVKPE